MDVLVAGAHGKIGQRLVSRLADEGHRPHGLIRREEQAEDVETLGGLPVVLDLEQAGDLGDAVAACDAIVFAAGAGPGSGAERKETMDYGGAVKLVEAAEAAGVARYVIVSAMGAADPEAGPETMRPYLRAKARADERVMGSGLDWTVVRPGSLTDEPGSGRVAVRESLGRSGEVPRDDVAAVLAATLVEPATVRRVFDVLSGDVEVAEALRSL